MNRRKRGKEYEDAAGDFLEKAGYRILGRNFRIGRNEIDIICTKNNALIFVEVKGGKSREFGDPVLKIDERKRKAIASVAEGFMQRSLVTYDAYRFDVVVVSEKNKFLEIEQIESAFTL